MMAGRTNSELNDQLYGAITGQIKEANKLQERKFTLNPQAKVELKKIIKESIDKINPRDSENATEVQNLKDNFIELANFMIEATRNKGTITLGIPSFKIALDKFCPRFPIC